jgi:hypothetical protein
MYRLCNTRNGSTTMARAAMWNRLVADAKKLNPRAKRTPANSCQGISSPTVAATSRVSSWPVDNLNDDLACSNANCKTPPTSEATKKMSAGSNFVHFASCGMLGALE